jgi:DNA-binding transcriptional LysR family regulator
MELRHLRYFVAVAEELHFGRAAARLNIAQPPLSQQIQQLEKELAVTLFMRTRRSVALTDAGSAFLREARRTLAQAEQAVRAAQRAARGETGRIVVGFISSATYTVFTDILRSFAMRHPGVEVVLEESTTEQQLRALAEGRIDIGFLRAPVEAAGLTVSTLVREPVIAAVPAFHPLARAQSIALKKLAAEAFISLPRRMLPGFHDYLSAACMRAGFVPRVAHEAHQLQTVISLVAAGMGVALVPASLQKAQRRGVRYLDIAGTPLYAEIVAAHVPRALTGAQSAFLNLVNAAAANEGEGGEAP